MRQVIICAECGGLNILQREWVYVNDGSIMLDSGAPTFEYEDQWCNDCNKHVDFKEKSDNPK
jgi:hypothetical protein